MRLHARLDPEYLVRKTVLVLRFWLLLGFLRRLVFVLLVCFVVRECDRYFVVNQLLLIPVVGIRKCVEEGLPVCYCCENVVYSYLENFLGGRYGLEDLYLSLDRLEKSCGGKFGRWHHL